MKGARKQLLDIKNKTQYQFSSWSSVTHVQTAQDALAGRGKKFINL